MSIKVRNTTRYLLTEQLKMVGWSILTLFVAFGVLPLLFALITGNIRQYSPLANFADLSLGALFFMFIFIVGALTYDNFKLFIQNGLSRQTYFQARVLALLTLSGLFVIINAIYYYGVHAPYLQWSTNTALMKSGYALYAYALGSQVWLNILASLLFNWIFYIGVGLTGMACGTLLALFGKWAKTILIISIPIIGMLIIWIMALIMARNQSTYNYTGLENFLKFIIGYPGHEEAKTGYFNPTMPFITMLVGCGIIGGLAYLFNRKLRIRN
ncbi:ABC transporter permease [Lactiplantibacillus sp. DA1]|uniref:ABC transporter permease n=1 Tax=Lactiplantibacillus sp. DA1 TaxID=3079857 RepID=UPI00292A5F91|nr:ABC transporter permease [Lactiplantibacillus sp. DA1]MDV0431831.1 ABC transporter permease [Lactiplantibacillus sp. DA1]